MISPAFRDMLRSLDKVSNCNAQPDGPSLPFVSFAILPHEVDWLKGRFPAAIPAEDFLEMLRGDQRLACYASDVEKHLAQKATLNPNRQVFACLN